MTRRFLPTSLPIPLPILLLALLAPLLTLGACSADPTAGYANVSPHRSDITSVSVPIFDNITHHHGAETMLTQALMRRIQRQTPWSLAAGAQADSTLTGSIVSIELERLGQDRVTGLGNEMAIDIAVDFRWVDNRSGEPIVARRNFRGSATFVPAQGVREPIETGIQGAVESLAESMIAELRTDW